MADASPSSPEQQILARMQVPGARGLYVLGCFERRVTLYSQQVRALNLVYALRDQLLATKPAVAVIGAGASGITAAVAAAACGCRVAVFERLGSPLGFIGPARTRWLHPHIYDWPANGAEDPDAGLPILTWREGMADRVGEELQTQWHERADQFQIDLHCNVSDLSIDEDAVADADGRPQHLLTCNGTGPEPRHRGRHDDPGPGGRSGHHMLMGRFDIVILAVGFGVEAPSEKFPQVNSYWENDRIDEEDRHSKRPERHVLISGTGDGGLIDLLRYSFSRFRHDEILKRLRDHLAAQGELERVLQTIQQIEADAVAHSQAGRPYIAPLNLAYRTLIDSLPSRAMLPVRRNIRATLTGRNKQPFDLESAALNRFLACFTDYEWIPLGTTAVHRTGDHGPYAVTLANGETRSFDEALVRHGPTSALEKSFPSIAARCGDLATLARATAVTDPARLPVYGRFYDDLLRGPRADVETTTAAPTPAQLEAMLIAVAGVEPAATTPTEPATPAAAQMTRVEQMALAPGPETPADEPAPRYPVHLIDLAGRLGVPVAHFDDPAFFELLVEAPDSVDRAVLFACTWAVRHVPKLTNGVLKRIALAVFDIVRSETRGGQTLYQRVAANLAGAESDRLKPFVRRLIELTGRDEKKRIRARAIIALGELRDAAALEVLIETLRHDERDNRELAAAALGTIGQPAAIGPLLQAYLHDEGELVLDEALEALVAIGGEEVVTPLLALLRDPALSTNLRWPTASALGRLGERRAIPVLIETLAGEDGLLREHAAEALGMLGDPEGAPQLRERLRPLLADPQVAVRRQTIEALARFPSPDTTQLLLGAFLQDNHEFVREAAGTALLRLDPMALLAAINRRGWVSLRFDEIWRWLRAASGPPAAMTMRDRLKVTPPPARVGYARGLAMYEDEGTAAVLLEFVDDSSPEVRWEAIAAVGRARYRPAVTALVSRVLTDPADHVRIAAVTALGDIGDAAAIDALCDALRHPKLGSFAATALGKIGDRRAVAALAEAARTSLAYDPEPAIIAIARIDGEAAVEALSRLFAVQEDQGRASIMRWAADAAHPAIVGLLLRGTEDESRAVRVLAHDGLRALSWQTISAGCRALLLSEQTESTLRRRALQLAPTYARADAEMRGRIDRTRNDESTHDPALRLAADQAWRGLTRLDAVTAYRPPAQAQAQAQGESSS